MMDGSIGEASCPDNCTECGCPWSATERLHTGDDKGWDGWEDWVYCGHCKFDFFYPVAKPAAQGAAR